MELYVIVTFVAAILFIAMVVWHVIERAIENAQIDKDEEVISLRAENVELRESNEALLAENTKLKKERVDLLFPLNSQTKINKHEFALERKNSLYCYGERKDNPKGEDDGEGVRIEDCGTVESDREL